MGIKTDATTKCAVDDCTKEKGFWECDICMRRFCGDHILDLDILPRISYNKYRSPENATVRTMTDNNVRMVCYDCLSLAELKEVDDIPDEDLPLSINKYFITDRADKYYFHRATGGKRDPHIFDFGLKIIKDLVAKIKEDLKNEQVQSDKNSS
jgi:hypothetical protein